MTSKEYRLGKISWSDLSIYEQAHLIAYEQIREMEEAKELEYIALAGLKKVF